MSHPTVVFASVLGEVGELLARSGVFAKFIVLLLFVLSVISWAVMIERGRLLAAARKGNSQFWRRFERARSGDLATGELANWSEENPKSPLARLYLHFAREFWPVYEKERAGEREQKLLLGLLARGLDRETETVLGEQERGLGWLATLSSVAPFLGLLGTVWGIMNSFLQLGRQGAATLDVVGPGIAEALITTVCGLAVAIPSVVAYNYFTRRLQDQEDEMQRLSSVLADVVAESELRAPAGAALG